MTNLNDENQHSPNENTQSCKHTTAKMAETGIDHYLFLTTQATTLTLDVFITALRET